MGDVLKVFKTAKNAVNSVKAVRNGLEQKAGIADLVGHGQSQDPGVNPTDPTQGLYASLGLPDVASAGASSATPQDQQQPSMMDSLLGTGGGRQSGPPSMADMPQAPAAPVNDLLNDYDASDVSGQAMAASAGQHDDPNKDITVDGFKPTHEGFLARAVDTLLQFRGRQPIFENRIKSHDIDRAMEGFSQDPETAIHHVMAVDKNLGTQMWDKYTDNQRQQSNLDRQNNLFDLKRDQVVEGRVAGLLNSADPNDPDAMKAMAERARAYAISKGADDVAASIPEDLTSLDRTALTNGFLSVKDQRKLEQGDKKIEQGDRRLDQGDRKLTQGDVRLGQQGADTQSRIASRSAKISQGDRRLDQGQQKIDAANQAAMRKLGLPNSPAEGYSKMSPNGKQGLKYHNGRWMKFERGEDGNMHPVGYL